MSSGKKPMIGDAINTDYGSAYVAEVRENEDEDGRLEVGFVGDGQLVWADAAAVVRLG